MATKAEDAPVKKKSKKQKAVASGELMFPPLMSLRQQVDKLFEQFLEEGWMRPSAGFTGIWDSPLFKSSDMSLRDFIDRPRTDLSESGDAYELSVELPGMSKKDVEVRVKDNMITLKGEKKSQREAKEKDYHISERSYGSVRRSFSLPAGVDAKKVTADFSKGVLTVHLPKTEEARSKPQKIEVKGE